MSVGEFMNSITATELSRILEDEILPRVEKPSRYLGCEVNATRKEAAPGDVRIALAFPDLYDLGLPNLGLLILYDILNRREGVHAERVYAPGLDLEAILRERRLPLFSLESRTPLAQFDCIGFTLQYELCYTNLLNMLDLAGIPLQSSQREDRHPIILAGGPCALNPEPLADFIDAFAIGDGEEVIVEIAEALRATKGVPRAERLRRLAEIEGVYVPALYETRTLPDGTVLPVGPKVRKRVVALEGAPFPTEYVVPFTQQVHDRVSLEVLRGCTQGCRFCQAGMMNRPVRERSLKTLRELQEAALRATGYEEIALASLSTCDYSRVRSLVAQTVEAATPWGTAVSLPSLRLDSFSVDLVEMVQSMRKSGLTFAPEAATPRLRAVINKGITDEDLLETTAEVFRRGWEVVKLYFMIGLPTETEEDVAAIAELSRRVLAGGRSFRRNARINLGVSTFVPRPHTPFQWERQISLEETQAKQRLLAERLRGGVKFGRHDAFASYLEGVFARGDRRVGGALLEAWRRGARMDAWSEHFDFARWQEAFATVGLNPDDYLRERDPEAPLPWEHLDILVTRDYLLAERERSRCGELTLDCRRDRCHQCGVLEHTPHLCAEMRRNSREGAQEEREWTPIPLPDRPALDPAQRIRFRFAKEKRARLLSHLETVGVWTRALRRAQAPLAYSQGYHPQPKLAFGTALAVGVESIAEYADVVLNERLDPVAFAQRINALLPDGIRVLEAREVPLRAPSLSAAIRAVRYEVTVPREVVDGRVAHERVESFLARKEYPITRERPKGPQQIDLRAGVLELSACPAPDGSVLLEMLLREGNGASIRPADLVAVLFSPGQAPLRVRKLESYLGDGDRLEPVMPREESVP